MHYSIITLFMWCTLGVALHSAPPAQVPSLAQYKAQREVLLTREGPAVSRPQKSVSPTLSTPPVSKAQALISAVKNPKQLVTKTASASRPLIKNMMDTMSSIKRYMSPRQWWSVMTEFVGSLFIKFWSSVWGIVRDSLVTIVGPEKIYELKNDGTIKTDAHGTKLPRLLPQFSLSPEGEAIKTMVPTKWYNALENKDSLLGLLVTSGIDGSVAATFKSLDRLFFRPMASSLLDIPLWKLSYVHYKLAMTELQNPGRSIITPHALAQEIMSTRDTGLILTANFPFNLRSIMSAKDNKEKFLLTAITQHLWSIYQPIWQELEPSIQIKDNNNQYTPTESNLAAQGSTKFNGPQLSKTKDFGQKLVDEAAYIGRESLKAKVLEGPLAQYVAYAGLALNIPQVIFGAQFNTQPAAELIDNTGTPLNDDTRQKLLKAIDICDALASKARSKNIENKDDETFTEYITAYHTPGVPTYYKASINKELLAKLLTQQERGLREYLPFCSHFAGEPYDSYIMKLLMPRMIIKCIPLALREELGILTYADATASIDIIKNKFNLTFKSLAALSSLMATIKKFEGTQSFAGRYVEIADTFDRCIQDLSALVHSAYPVPLDNWQKRLTSLSRRTLHSQLKTSKNPIAKYIPKGIWVFIKQAKALSVTQQNRLKIAASKSGTANPILYFDRTSILNYINNNTLPTDFNGKPTDLNKVTAGIINRAVKRQKMTAPLDSYTADTIPLSYNALLEILDTWYITGDTSSITTPTSDKKAVQETLDRAYKIILHTFGLLSLHHATKVDAFFNADTTKTEKSAAKLASDYKKFEDKINNSLALKIGNIQEFISVLHSFYTNYGLREIIAALDEHYYASGQTAQDLPLKTIGKIALKEGSAHLVGYGADRLLKGLLNKVVLPRIAMLQSSGVIGGNVINQMAQQHLSTFIGNTGGKTNAYHAARALIKNVFDYGASTALQPKQLMATAAAKLIPAQFSGGAGTAEYAELMAHAEMARDSGKAPSPIIAQRLKKMGIDPNNLPQTPEPSKFFSMEDFNEEEFLKQFGG